MVQYGINKLVEKSEEIFWSSTQKYKVMEISERLQDKEDIINMCNLHVTEWIIKKNKKK